MRIQGVQGLPRGRGGFGARGRLTGLFAALLAALCLALAAVPAAPAYGDSDKIHYYGDTPLQVCLQSGANPTFTYAVDEGLVSGQGYVAYQDARTGLALDGVNADDYFAVVYDEQSQLYTATLVVDTLNRVRIDDISGILIGAYPDDPNYEGPLSDEIVIPIEIGHFDNNADHLCDGCGAFYPEDHVISTEWSYDEAGHWHACTAEGCNARSGYAEHLMDWVTQDGLYWAACIDNCGYTTEPKEVPEASKLDCPDVVCPDQDLLFSFVLPEGTVGANAAFEFPRSGSGFDVSVVDGVAYGTMPAKWYQLGEEGFELTVRAVTEDGYEVLIERKHISIAAGHDIVDVPEVPATVEQEGLAAHWACDRCGKAFSDAEGTQQIPLEDLVLEKLPPSIVGGAGQSTTVGEENALTFRSNASFADFMYVLVDEEEIDADSYTVEEGSTVVTLLGSFVATLPVGEHTIDIVSQNGTATASFTVTEKGDGDGTGDNGDGDNGDGTGDNGSGDNGDGNGDNGNGDGTDEGDGTGDGEGEGTGDNGAGEGTGDNGGAGEGTGDNGNADNGGNGSAGNGNGDNGNGNGAGNENGAGNDNGSNKANGPSIVKTGDNTSVLPVALLAAAGAVAVAASGLFIARKVRAR